MRWFARKPDLVLSNVRMPGLKWARHLPGNQGDATFGRPRSSSEPPRTGIEPSWKICRGAPIFRHQALPCSRPRRPRARAAEDPRHGDPTRRSADCRCGDACGGNRPRVRQSAQRGHQRRTRLKRPNVPRRPPNLWSKSSAMQRRGFWHHFRARRSRSRHGVAVRCTNGNRGDAGSAQYRMEEGCRFIAAYRTSVPFSWFPEIQPGLSQPAGQCRPDESSERV